MKAVMRFKNEIWYLDLKYVDKQAHDNNGVKNLLFCQDLFHWTVDEKETKTKDSKNISCIFDEDYEINMTHKSFGPQKNGFCWKF